jgi:N-acetylglucosamine malate deacetylase 2
MRECENTLQPDRLAVSLEARNHTMTSAGSRCLLLSFAHPDDETFLAGGVCAKYASLGAKVVLSTATLGESGKAGDPPVCTPEDLPAVREGELRAAAAILGIHEVHLLGYRDRELASAPADRIRAQLVQHIRSARPAVVVTFDPQGANQHPDHIAISRFTSDAVAAAADGRWFPEAGEAHDVRRLVWVPGRRPWEWLRDPELARRGGADFVVDIAPWRERKLEALRVHRTQRASVERNFLAHADIDRLLGAEVFRLGWGPITTRPLGDLFDGL